MDARIARWWHSMRMRRYNAKSIRATARNFLAAPRNVEQYGETTSDYDASKFAGLEGAETKWRHTKHWVGGVSGGCD
jgi:hypothetical protein